MSEPRLGPRSRSKVDRSSAGSPGFSGRSWPLLPPLPLLAALVLLVAAPAASWPFLAALAAPSSSGNARGRSWRSFLKLPGGSWEAPGRQASRLIVYSPSISPSKCTVNREGGLRMAPKPTYCLFTVHFTLQVHRE